MTKEYKGWAVFDENKDLVVFKIYHSGAQVCISCFEDQVCAENMVEDLEGYTCEPVTITKDSD